MTQLNYITLSELQQNISGALGMAFPGSVWVSAEILDMKVNSAGHCYMELVEKDPNNETIAKAQVRAVIWRSRYSMIASRFMAECKQSLRSGIKILALVNITYHQLYGLSLQITDIDATYTIGDLERQKQQTIEQLKKDGLWDLNHRKDVPVVLQNIAVISSEQAAGYRDFFQEITSCHFTYNITLFGASMQGLDAEGSICEALRQIEDSPERFDCVVIIRGGGSVGDLNCYNSYTLAAACSKCSLPVLSGIGHDKDVSIVDMVARIPLKTPTAVATFINDHNLEFEGVLDEALLFLKNKCLQMTKEEELGLQKALSELHRFSKELLLKRQNMMNQTAYDVVSYAKNLIGNYRFQLENLKNALLINTENTISNEHLILENYEQTISSFRVENLLALGYSILSSKGKTVREIEELKSGDDIEIRLAKGTVEATVKNVKRK